MAENVLVVSPPTRPGTEHLLVQEECCMQFSHRPFLPSHMLNALAYYAARHGRADYHDCSLQPAWQQLDLSRYDVVYTVASYNLGETVFWFIDWLLDRHPRVILGANPYQYREWLAQRFPRAADVRPLYECFQTDREQPLDLVPTDYLRHYNTAFYQLSTGCYHGCKFCTWHNTFRLKKPDVAAADIAAIHEKLAPHGWRNLSSGATLTVLTNQLTHKSHGWLRRFAHAKRRAAPTTHISVNVNAKFVNRKAAKLLRACSVGTAVFGAESLSDPFLETIDKPHRVEDVVHAVRCLNRQEIPVNMHLRTDMGETPEDVQRTRDSLLGMVDAGLFISQVNLGRIVYWDGTFLQREASPQDIDHSCKRHGVPWPKRRDCGKHDELYSAMVEELERAGVRVRWSRY